jgi:multiple sugar transport system substrate-binding protein|tara:strand:- start:274 stop:1536 length:1263 start_codon:yes stop_codon:yes gene_type:complete
MEDTLKNIKLFLFSIIGSIFIFSSITANAVEIEYWQYTYKARVEAIDKLIANFEKANPDITVKHTSFPYADYRKKVSIAISSGDGPDLVQLYYGWLNDYRDGGLIQPLPKDTFPHDEIESNFFKMVSSMKVDGDYWGLPTAVRSLALFYNNDLFSEAGLSGPPETLDQMVEYAKKLTKTDSAGNYIQVGFAVDTDGQDHHFWREVLIRHFGGQPYSNDGQKVTYNTDAGAEALKYLTDFEKTHKTGSNGFMNRGQDAFAAGKAGMVLDGSFRISKFNKTDGLNFSISELPGHNGTRYNFSSFWANALSTKAKGEKKEAAAKFLKYLTSEEAMQVWLDTVGELPAKPSVALVDANKGHPQYGPFIRGLDYATATTFISEKPQRQSVIDSYDMVVLQGMSPEDALAKVAKKEQELLDDFFGN